MVKRDLIIVGAGPAGLSAAKIALEAGLSVTIIERSPMLGGQLTKQTHKFFGSKEEYAKTRGIDIAKILISELDNYKDKIEILQEATVVGMYKDYVLTIYQGNKYFKLEAKAIIIATGASEKVLAFENNDLPGIYGAGAVQTLMNLYGVLPGQEVVMVGSGNIGLIVSYQMIQAGVKVKALLEAAPTIGGYLVHAAKLVRLGVPIITKTTVKKAFGKEKLEKIQTVKLDDHWEYIDGTEAEITCDALCISVGLSPLHQLLSMAEIEMIYVNELGGLIPKKNSNYETSMPHVYACGDVTGIEEASSAMVEGKIAGLMAAAGLGNPHPNHKQLEKQFKDQLMNLRQGPCGVKIRQGLEKAGEAI
ncbi:NAD(P)/FAD-dependent oxidoreductase [Candidatus Izemoplasma sp. B36]|uniref:NAD(P)/FAD-dependent oxidoreductase n=1 Tax=Candidatus Izemoplasma sp. B36 TaxID=3242468 RepID=UPI0035583489